VIIALGVAFLISTLGYDPPIGVFFRDYWPFLLIAVGLTHIGRHFFGGFGSRPGTLTSGAILTTLGILFAFQQLGDVPFRSTWPVLLIVAGATALVQFTRAGAASDGKWHRGGFRR